MNNITEFNFNSMDVRVITKNNDPWFVLIDVCKILELENPRNITARLDEDEKDAVHIVDTIGRSQEMTIINESGLYSLILRSRKPEAKRFKKWVTSEVLPAIRKTGSYQSVDLNDPVFLRSTLLTYADKCLALEKENQVMKPKAKGFDLIADTKGAILPSNAAKELKMQICVFSKKLIELGWCYRRGRINRKGPLTGTSTAIQGGYVTHYMHPYFNEQLGKITYSDQLMITKKGLAKLATIFAGEAA